MAGESAAFHDGQTSASGCFQIRRTLRGDHHDILRGWQYELSNSLREAASDDDYKSAIRSYIDKVIGHEAFGGWTTAISHHSLAIPSRRFPSTLFTISWTSEKLRGDLLALVEEMYLSHTGVFSNHTFFEILMPHESDFCGLEHNVLVALGDLPKCDEDLAVMMIAPLRVSFGLQACHELRIPEKEVGSLALSTLPEFYKDSNLRKMWMTVFYTGNPGTLKEVYRYCYTYPQESRDRNEVDQETVVYSLCNLAKLLGCIDDSSKGAFFCSLLDGWSRPRGI